MLALGPLTFAAPLALLGFLVLPALYFLLRATPPAPKRVIFPPLRLLLGLEPDEDTPAHTPWWVIALRVLLITAVILGLARPQLTPQTAVTDEGPLVVVMDDGWASAPNWRAQVRSAAAVLEAADRADRPVALAFTAPRAANADRWISGDADGLIRRLQARRPAPWPIERTASAAIIAEGLAGAGWANGAQVIWLSDGLAMDGDDAFARSLSDIGPLTVRAPAPRRLPIVLSPPVAEPGGFAVTLSRADAQTADDGAVLAVDAQGRVLARAPFAFDRGVEATSASVETPLEIRNRIAALRLETNASAGGAQILDDAWRRPLVGLASASAEGDRQPLLADLHYVGQALAPAAETVRGPVSDLLARDPGAVFIADTAAPTAADREALTEYVVDGGLIVRFAGPRLADNPDDLIPVDLRVGGRLLGGALAWDDPQPIAAFPETSPFFGIALPEGEALVTRQVLAEPTPELSDKVWARLTDGTPIVTAERRGRGWLVFFHITAGPDWSELPLSGVFAQMLARTLTFAADRPPAPDQAAASGPWTLDTAINPDGRLEIAEVGAAVDADMFAEIAPGPASPPGVYVRGAARQAVNVTREDTDIAPLADLPGGVVVETGGMLTPQSFAGPLLLTALILLALDAIAMAALAGRVRLPARFAGKPTQAAAMALGGVAVLTLATPPTADAQNDDRLLDMLNTMRLAYVVTGDPRVDAMSQAGLRGLSRELARRSSVEPGAPLAIALDTDEIGAVPLLYWPVTAATTTPSETAAAKLDLFLKTGGVLLLDTQDGGVDFALAPNAGLTAIASVLDIPPLADIPEDHVLTRSFYLIDAFPGRWRSNQVWVEADQMGSARDGVSSVIIGSGDWAAAWAIDDAGEPLAAIAPGMRNQREFAYRFGVNVVMYVLTGNYKADQVHIPAILERLGQ